MAKSARSSQKKNNNQRKAATVFGPTETARAERLSAKLLQVAKAPKPESSDVNMDATNEEDAEEKEEPDGTTMEVDSKTARPRSDKHRISKRRFKKTGIVFTKYSDRVGSKKKKVGK